MNLFSNIRLTEEEIDKLTETTVFESEEIEILYNRFVFLDKFNSGFLTHMDIQSIPELDANPFCVLIINYFETKEMDKEINFKSFLEFLGIFSERTKWCRRCDFYFNIFDLQGNGKLTQGVLKKIYKMLKNNDKNTEEIEYLFKMYDKKNKGYINKEDFLKLYRDDPEIDRKSIIDFKTSFREINKATIWDILWPSGNKN